jgi:hypothetical protein
MTSLALADNRKDIFALETALAGVSDTSSLKLTKLLHAVHREVQEARRVNDFLRQEGFEKIAPMSAVMAELEVFGLECLDINAFHCRASFNIFRRSAAEVN